jgi:alkylation response protein AidB-like acyl-CoA dehydrogenase
MDFRPTGQEQAFKSEFSGWLDKNLPEGWNEREYQTFEDHGQWEAAHRDFQRRLFQAGYAGMNYPAEYGGRGRSLGEEVIVNETIAERCFELRLPGLITFGMAGPTLLLCGSEEQKKTLIPGMLKGDHIWCQGFSEPNAGSDVVNVAARAVKEGSDYIVNGQKIWTSFAHMSDYCMLLVRTDPDAPKHKGLTYLLMDMKLPGVEVRPIRQMTGEAEYNEIFMDDVRIPGDMLVGAQGQGWRIAITTLMFERAMGDATMSNVNLRNLKNLVALARQTKRSGAAVITDPVFRQEIARRFINVMVTKYHGYRSLNQILTGGAPGPESSIGKLLWSLDMQKISETALEIQGPYGQLTRGSEWALQSGSWQHSFLTAKGTTIAAGTTEVLRNIIGERVLGLPKDSTRVSR